VGVGLGSGWEEPLVTLRLTGDVRTGMYCTSSTYNTYVPCGEVTGYGFGRFLLGRMNGSTSFFFLGGSGRGTASAPGRTITAGCLELVGSCLSCAATWLALIDLCGIWSPRSLESGLGLAELSPRGPFWEVVYSRWGVSLIF
jgi:hypothetical protein